MLGLVTLGVLWTGTLELVGVERRNAESRAIAATREFVGTYEAQVVRAIREIDLTLKVVKYDYETNGGRADLAGLRARALLPPDLVFVESIADRHGNIVASTRPVSMPDLSDRRYFREQLIEDRLSVGLPRQDAESGEWVVQFSRRLEDSHGEFDGIVMLTVGADFFVSGYEEAQLGQTGLLGVVGTDGVFRARRSGDIVSYGDFVNYSEMLPSADQEEAAVQLTASPWDGVPRFAAAHQLYDVPLAVVVGLSRAERLADVDRAAAVYTWRAAGASVVMILILAWLGHMSSRIAQARREAVASQLEHAERVEYLAYHDGLTGLPNRSFFSKLLKQQLDQAQRFDRLVAVLFLDLDRFKQINDTLGHEAGDQLLIEVAKRLSQSIRGSDVVARLGGDEFVLSLPELSDESYAGVVAKKVISEIAKPFILSGHEFRVTGSLGITLYPRDGLDEETLTKNADTAMYQAKEQGKNNYQFYSEEMNAESLDRLALEVSLRRALEHKEFAIHYQAKRDLPTGHITGVEALLRWRHPELGMIAPLRFLAVAEQIGLTVAIGKWVLETACAQIVEWQGQGLPRLRVAVNLTPLQFLDSHLLADIESILRATAMPAEQLELEITEGMLMHDVQHTLRILAGLKALGVRVAVDDFGIGYTTLATLRQFPLDTIKIDRSFIRDLTQVDENRALTAAIIAMGKTLSMTVVAQGVETKEQAEFLRLHACDELQGFYFNRPVPAVEFVDLLHYQADEVARGRDAAVATWHGIVH